MEYSVYFRGPQLPRLADWSRELKVAAFPVTLPDEFSFEPEEGEAEAQYNGQTFYFGFFVVDADPTRPPEASEARNVAVFQPEVWLGVPDGAVMLAATFAVITDGWMRNDASGEVFRGAEAIEYARWYTALPDDGEP